MPIANQPASNPIQVVDGHAVLSPSMIQDLPILTQSEPLFGQSVVSSVGVPAAAGEQNRSTHSSRRRRKTRVHEGAQGEEAVFQPGCRLVDRYEIVRKIGQGGMSLVYEAVDEVRSEHVALKVLLPSLAVREKMQERFVMEGRIASNFSHPNIARVYDIHQTETLNMLSMELLHGSTLRHDMERRKAQRQGYRPTEVLTMIQQVCSALEVIHAGNVIHRDLKPENLWLGLDESIKVMDFGIARDSVRGAMTTGPRGSGTPYYIAPEQLSASPNLDARADQYALGVIAYEMLTGNIPQGVIRPPHTMNSTIPRKISMAVYRAVQSDPENRFLSVQDFAEAARFKTGTSWWVKAGLAVGLVGLLGGSALGIQFGLLPLLASKPSPVWAAIPPQSVVENGAMSFVCRHPESTLNGQNLSFKLLADAPVGATIDAATGTFEWTPNESQGPKDYNFKIMAIVTQAGMSPVVEEQPFRIKVTEQFDAPKMEIPDAITVKEHELLKVQLDAKDINVPAVGLRYELLQGPAGMTLDARTGILQWKPQENDGGSTQAPIVRVALDSEDHLDAAVTRTLNIRVDESIDAPKFTSSNRLQAEVGIATKFRFTARDPNAPEINRYFRLRNGDRFGISVDPQSGELFWTPTEDQAGKEFELIAEIAWDGAGKSETLVELPIKVKVAELKVEPKPDTADASAPPVMAETGSDTATIPIISAPQPTPTPATCPTPAPRGGNGTAGGTSGGNGSTVGGTCPLPGNPTQAKPVNGNGNRGQVDSGTSNRGNSNPGNGGNANTSNRLPLPFPIPGFPPPKVNAPTSSKGPRIQQGIRIEDIVKQTLQNEFKRRSQNK